MKKKNNELAKKQDKKILIASIVLVVVVIMSVLALVLVSTLYSDNNNQSADTNDTMMQYDTYNKINSDELFTLLNENTTSKIVYVGRDTCPVCATFAPLLTESIQETGSLVYYYDTAAARADDADKLSELMNKLSVSSVPALLKIENGEVIERLGDYKSKEAILNFLN